MNAPSRLSEINLPLAVLWLRGLALVGLMGCAFITVMMPDKVPLLLMLLLALAIGVGAFLFPWFTLGLAVAQFIVSIDWFYGANEWVANNVGALEMSSFQKLVVLLATLPAFMRGGIRARLNPPLLALLFMLAMTFTISSTFPSLTPFQSVKTLLGLGLPFIFFSMKMPRRPLEAYILVIALLPVISVVLGYFCELQGFMNLDRGPWKFYPQEYTGVHRLAGINIAAGLAYFGFISVFLSLYQALTRGKRWYFLLAAVSTVIVVLTLTRMPIACVLVFAVLSTLVVSHRSLKWSNRVVLFVLGALVIAVVLTFSWSSLETRFFGVGSHALNTSARDELWPIALSTFNVNPVFGRGLGTGAIFLLDNANSMLAQLRVTHNEYLRLLLDGGVVGLVAYILALGFLIVRESSPLTRDQKKLVAILFFVFAFYSFTDNTISGPPTIVLFFSLASVFALGRYEAESP